jgi:hypothetical protein
MRERYEIDVKCPNCGRSGQAIVDDGPPFSVHALPPYFRITREADQGAWFKVGCQCGEIFDLMPTK